MNEFYALDAKYTCCGCLKISGDLLTMSADDITLYKKNVEVDSMDNVVKICYICRHMLHKFQKFVLQCQHTSKIMKCVVEGDADALSKYKPNSFNYVSTILEAQYYNPELEFEVPSYKNDDIDNFNDDIENINDGDEIKHDDDDIPLVMFKDTVKEEVELAEIPKLKKKRKRKHNNSSDQQNLKEKKIKQKKQLKEGFSSRMVQETEEYEVIKLTKEQVIQEMVEKCKSDKYLQCMYKCEKCAKGFNFKDVLENHMKKHSQENGAFKCEICAQYCPSTVSLRGHMKSHTTRYKCKICGAIRISRQHLLEHYSIEHTFDASNYTCDHCPFTTRKRTVIQRHVRTHRLGKNLTCSVCGAGFSNMHSLRMHTTRHDPTTRYSCRQCNAQFVYPSQLHRHKRTHARSDCYCVECDVTFRTIGKHTSNLKVHLAAKHTSEYIDVTTINENIKESEDTGNNTSKTDKTISTLKELSMQLIAIHGRPLALLNDKPFQKILNIAAAYSPRSKEINEKNVKIMISEAAYKIKFKIAAEISKTLISLKIDSATCAERRFLGINIQYIYENNIKVRNLAILELFESQTAEFLKAKLIDVLNEFLIPTEQIYSITTDNGGNMKKMTKLMKGNFWTDDDDLNLENDEEDNSDEDENADEELIALNELTDVELSAFQSALSDNTEPNFKIRGMLCAAHTLQLAIKDAIDANVEAQSTLDLARKIARTLRTPSNRNLLKLANFKVPIIDCATRWTSKYNMLLRLQDLRTFCDSIESIAMLVSSAFWDEISDMLTCLEHFHICTMELQTEQLTIGDFYISWIKCKSKMDSMHTAFACSLRAAMQNRQQNLLETDVVLEGLYLDGRINVVLSDEQCVKARALLKQTFNKTQYLGNRSRNAPSPIPIVEGEPGPSTGITLSADLLPIEQMLARTELLRGLQCTGTMASIDACLAELRNTSRLPLDTKIVNHWCTKTFISSELAGVAKAVLATPATQVSVERMFSALKFLLNPLRSNLDSVLLQNMLFIRSNKDLLETDL